MNAREDILARVRAAVMTDSTRLGDAVADQAPVPRAYRTTGEQIGRASCRERVF